MRFEIKSGGVVAILFGVAALSGAVFMLGLLAGYDVGRESQSSAAQVATAYPVAAPSTGAPATESSVASDAGGRAAPAPPPALPAPHPATVPPAESSPASPLASAKPIAAAKPPKRATAQKPRSG